LIKKETVEHIAKLAKLTVTDAQKQMYADQLSKVLGHIGQLEALNTDGIEPLLTASPIEFYYRPDEVKPQLSVEEKLQNAPERSGNLVKVPPVVG
jgi:aspartyl-tRNA(Asn)/glutamyl-tRNA(Gln) amidotransferase subunit C